MLELLEEQLKDYLAQKKAIETEMYPINERRGRVARTC